ncbi:MULTISPECIES: hypothetical protein [unclassified Nonomuraea]|uniref:hypothetical protein n=1 Tax=unclassified Nonomuraea TaxID=2593643 RepID=UPI0035C1AB5F
MKDTGKVALAAIGGYCLGRQRKLRMAIALASAGAVRKIRRDRGGLVEQGRTALSSSPELADLTSRLKGELLDVAKAAAVAAVTKQIESLTARLNEQTETLGQPEAGERAQEDENAEQEASEQKPKARVPKPRAPKLPSRTVGEQARARMPGAGRKRSSTSRGTGE